MNKGISIKAWSESADVSLAEILLTMKDRISGLKWSLQIEDTEIGPAASSLNSISPEQRISTRELLNAVSPNVQIIDGTIDGYDMENRLILRLRAVDSTWWDLETEDKEILQIIAKKFPDALKYS
jgi:hypothetical protein